MPHAPNRSGPHGLGSAGPIESGSVLHQLLVTVTEAIVRARSPFPPATTDRASAESLSPPGGPSNDIPAPDQPSRTPGIPRSVVGAVLHSRKTAPRGGLFHSRRRSFR